MNDTLVLAEEMLEHITPMKTDCGRVCGAACCVSREGEETGMLLFPGEEELYADMPGWRVTPAGEDLLAICPGSCDRSKRPLACRMFPLLPVIRDGGIRAAVDERAKAVCPLARQGKTAMDPAFTESVRKAGELLMRDETQRRFLERLTAGQAEWKELRKQFGGRHV